MLPALIWPDSSDGQARTNLRRQIHQLRTILPEPDRCLLIDTATLRWRAEGPCDVDLVDFQVQARNARLAAARGDPAALRSAGERAVAAYGGEFLPSVYDDWVIDARRRLHRLCVEMLDLLAPALAGEGDLPAAIRCAEQRIGLEPLDEAGYRALMTWQAQAGNRAMALRTFHRCAAILERELGVEPDGRTASVYRRLFQAPPEPIPGEGRPRRFARLVGRSGELSLLEDAWSGLTRGTDIVVIAGEAGVGKTRLVEEFAHAIGEQGHLVLRARCFLTMRRVALSPVAEWLGAPDLRGPVCGLSRDVRVLVARLAPGVGADLDPGQPDPLTGGWQRRVFFEALARALSAAGRSTLLLLDDLQWCDDEALAWLEFLQHLAPAAPVLLVAMLRSEELEDHPGLVDFCRRLQSLGRLRYHDIAPLVAEQVAELATTVLGRPIDSTTARKLEAQTGGFPLFIVEALRQGRVEAPRGDAVLAARLAHSVRTLCERHDVAYYAEWGRILEGRLDGGGVGETMIREGMAQLERDHCGTRMPFWKALLAEVLAGSGHRAEAALVLADARTRALAKGDRWWLAELWRLDADLHSVEHAEVMLDRALAVATEQGAVALMLRAATDLADRKRQAGKSREAAALLAPVRARARGCNPLELDAVDALLLGGIAHTPGRRRAGRLP